jgi:hypothetical protein
MSDLVVAFLKSLAEDHPFLLSACAFIGFMWFARSILHKFRLFLQHLAKEVRGFRLEVHECADDLRTLWQAFKLDSKASELKGTTDGSHEKVLAG